MTQTTESERSDEDVLLRLILPCDQFAPAAAREAMLQLPGDLGWALGDATLIASELVTNAVRHSLCPEDEVVAVSCARRCDRLCISVVDPGTSGNTARIRQGEDGIGGIGLKLVDQLSASWGTERHEQGYEVWAELPLELGGLEAAA